MGNESPREWIGSPLLGIALPSHGMKVISHTFGALLWENYAALKIAFSHGILNQQESSPAGFARTKENGSMMEA
jgi:hypothetical protein